MTTALTEEMVAWDGKSAAALRSIYKRHHAEEDFVATILQHLAEVESQRVATWLLKKHLESGNTLTAAECRAIFGGLSLQEHWESKLHLLQSIPYLNIVEEDCAALERFLDAGVRSDRKFVRAWAYNGFNELSLRFPRYRKMTDRMLAQARESEAASVRARIRNILKTR